MARPNPYVGPRAFEINEPLYGREIETRRLLNLFIAERIVLLYSPSGAGKTSLLQAALVGRLRERKFHVRPIIRVNQIAPSATPANRYLFSMLSALESAYADDNQIPATELAAMSLAAYLGRRPHPAESRFEVFVFDQFEELLTLNPTDAEPKRAFLTQLAETLDDPTRWALFAMREDYIAALDPYLHLIPTRFANTFRLDLLTVSGALEALQKPAHVQGVDFTDVAARKLVDDLRRIKIQTLEGLYEEQSGLYVEPVQLQVVGYRLWENLAPDATRITVEHLVQVGDVSESLADYYAQQTRRVAETLKISERTVREWVESKLITAQRTRGQALLDADQDKSLNAAIRLLENAHLVRAEKRAGATWFELAHDRLIEPVQQNNGAWFVAHLSLLQKQAALWNEQKRPESLLLSGKELAAAEAWARENTTELLAAERDFLDACRKEGQRIARERRRNWLVALLAGIASLLAIAALGFGVWAYALSQTNAVLAKTAQQQALIAQANQLEAQSTALREQQLDLSVLLGVEAYDRTSGFLPRRNLLTAVEFNPRLSIFLHGNSSTVESVAFSPDGKELASGGDSNTIMFWDVATGQPLGAPLTGHKSYVISVAFSPDGKMLASGSMDNTIILWDVATRQPLGAPLIGHKDSVFSVAFSPDGKTLASGSADKTVILWDVTTRQPLGAPLAGHADYVNSVAFSPDGKTLASGSVDKKIIVWDVATGQPLGAPLIGHKDSVFSVAFSPDGKTLASGSADKTIILWDVTTRQPLGAPLAGHSDTVNSVVFSPDGQTLASGSNDKTILLWNVATRQLLDPPLTGHSGAVRTVAFSPHGEMLASGSDDKNILLWNIAPRKLQEAAGATLLGTHGDAVNSVAFSPDGKMLASGSWDKTVILWDVATGQPLGAPLSGHSDSVFSVAFSPDGKTLASGSYNGTVTLWDVAARQPLGAPLTGHIGSVNSVAFSPDGKMVASGGQDKTIVLWDVATHRQLGSPFIGHTGSVNSVAFSPDGNMIASGGQDKTVILWDVATHQPIGAPLAGHSDAVNSVVFSPDGKMLASASSDRTILLWEVDTRQPLGQPFTGNTGQVRSVAFSPDGKTLASAGEDRSITLWDITDIAIRLPLGSLFTINSGTVWSVAFSPDGKTLATGSNDKTIFLWDVDLSSWLARACNRANRNLTLEEWKLYVGETEPFRKTCSNIP